MAECYCCSQIVEPKDLYKYSEDKRIFHNKCHAEMRKYKNTDGREVVVAYKRIKLSHDSYCTGADIDVPNLDELSEGDYRVDIPEDEICHVHTLPAVKMIVDVRDEEVNVRIQFIKRKLPWTGRIKDYEIKKTHCDAKDGSGYCSEKFGTTYEIISHEMVE